MQSEKILKITTKRQFQEMVEFMVKHPFLAKGLKFADINSSKEEFGREWETLTQKINSLGPPLRKSAEWQKVWSDYKVKLKKKLGYNKKQLTSTGGGSFKMAYVSPLEEQVINLLSLNEVVPLHSKVFGILAQEQQHPEQQREPEKQQGAEQHQESEQHQQEPEQQQQDLQQKQQQQQEHVDINQRKRKRQVDEFRKEMLDKQTKSLNKITNYLQTANKYLKRLSDAAEKKVKIFEETQTLKQSAIKLKVEIMEIQKKRMEMDISSQ